MVTRTAGYTQPSPRSDYYARRRRLRRLEGEIRVCHAELTELTREHGAKDDRACEKRSELKVLAKRYEGYLYGYLRARERMFAHEGIKVIRLNKTHRGAIKRSMAMLSVAPGDYKIRCNEKTIDVYYGGLYGPFGPLHGHVKFKPKQNGQTVTLTIQYHRLPFTERD